MSGPEDVPLPFDEPIRLKYDGRDVDTLATSREAAAVNAVTDATRQRRIVYEAILAAGDLGCTDDELQASLGLGGSSERPRRIELWEAGVIDRAQTPEGETRHRQTRTGRRAVVWVATRRP